MMDAVLEPEYYAVVNCYVSISVRISSSGQGAF